MSGCWRLCIMPTCCSHAQNSASPSILARFSSHGYQKVLEFTGELENAARFVVRWTESTTPVGQSKKKGDIHILAAGFACMHSKLQHLWELSWPASASIISGVCGDQTKKGTRHFQMLVAGSGGLPGWLAGWVGGWLLWCLAGWFA